MLRSESCARLRRDTPWNDVPEGTVSVLAHRTPHALHGEHRVTRGAARLPEPVRWSRSNRLEPKSCREGI